MKASRLFSSIASFLMLTISITACKERTESGEVIALKYENFSTLDDFPKHPSDEQYFLPKTDDFFLVKEKGEFGFSDDNDIRISALCDHISLTSYDKNGKEIQNILKLIFPDASSAKSYMDYQVKSQSETVYVDEEEDSQDNESGSIKNPDIYTQVENILYIESKDDFSGYKQNMFSKENNNPLAIAERKMISEQGGVFGIVLQHMSNPYITEGQMEAVDIEYATP